MNMIATIILAEANSAACKPWGRTIETAVANVRLVYAYNFEHNTTLFAAILKDLATADGMYNMMVALALGATMHRADAVNNTMLHVQRLVFDEHTSNKGTAASTTGYHSNSSKEIA